MFTGGLHFGPNACPKTAILLNTFFVTKKLVLDSKNATKS